MTHAKLLLLHPDDTVLIVIADIAAGETLAFEDLTATTPIALGVGHKVARHALPAGAKIIRYGAAIGSLTQDVAALAHVHMHNLKSDYIATHDRETIHG